MGVIDSFTGKYEFLCNFYVFPVEFEGLIYPTNEHAFQAAKSLDPAERERVRAAVSAHAAKSIGKTIALRTDWADVRYEVMTQIVQAKFSSEPMKAMLLATGSAKLIEGNHWGDKRWGCIKDSNNKWVGKNWLGEILMSVRRELR